MLILAQYQYNQNSDILEEMKKFDKKYVGKVNDYNSVRIADLEAEYISCPIYALMNYFQQKFLFSFITQTIMNERKEEIPVYKYSDFLSNSTYNNVILPQTIKKDFKRSLIFYSIFDQMVNTKIGKSYLRGSLKRESLKINCEWYTDHIIQMKTVFKNVQNLISYSPNIFHEVKGSSLNQTKKGKSIQEIKKEDLTEFSLLKKVNNNINMLISIQKSVIQKQEEDKITNMVQSNILLKRAYEKLENFQKYIELYKEFEDSDQDLDEYHKFPSLVELVFILAKTQRLDIISKYYQIKNSDKLFGKDKEGLKLIKKIKPLVEAIEYYHYGKWEKSIHSYITFLTKSYNDLDFVQWTRLFETVWYLAIATFFGTKYDIYIPVNALNYVNENCEVELEDGKEDNFTVILKYQREINIEPVQEKDPNSIFIKLLKNFEVFREEELSLDPSSTPRVMISLYNMVASLIINCEEVTSDL